MRALGSSGVWEMFVPALTAGGLYKFEIRNRHTGHTMVKADPYGFSFEVRPSTAARITSDATYHWNDQNWLERRGRSDWLRDPEEYTLPQYAMDMAVLIARLGVDEIDWIGTSLGGLVGMVLAGQPDTPIRRMVINDIGPFLPWQALQRLGTSIRNSPASFATLEAATQHLSERLSTFGDLTPEQWRHLALHSLEQQPDGRWRRLSDPNITASFRPGWYFNLSLWSYWDVVRCPTLVLRGEHSDLLSSATAADMTKRGPRATIVEFPDCGHAPALLDPAQIEPIVDWLG